MKKRICSFLLAFIMLGSSACALAAEPNATDKLSPRASLYLDGYSVSINPKGNSLMSITYIIYGTGKMDRIGAQKILVEEWDGINWVTTGTLSVGKNPEFYGTNASEHAGSTTFYGVPGIQYRATLTAYAEKDGGSDTGTITCTPKTCK